VDYIRGLGVPGRLPNIRLLIAGALVALFVLSLPHQAEARSKLKLEQKKKRRVVKAPVKVVAVPRGHPRKVTFAIDGRRVYTTRTAPYRMGGVDGDLNATTLKSGRHRVVVRAYFKKRKKAVARSVIRVVRRKVRAAGQVSVATTVTSTLPIVVPPPAPAPASSAQLRALLTNDMTLRSEVRASLSASWSQAPIRRSFPPASKFGALTAWGVLDNAYSGNPQPNAKVEIASAETWVYVKSRAQWMLFQNETGVTDGLFYTDDFSGATQNAGQIASALGGAAIGSIPNGFNFHFFPRSGRIGFTPGDIGGMVIAIRARLEPGTYDPNRPLPAYTLDAGADWWVSTTADWAADYSNNEDAGIGRFKGVDANMRLYTMSSGDLTTLPPITALASEAR